jgi:hypothetical protein
MAIVEAAPEGELYHIGRLPDVMAWTERQYVGDGRYDDPARPPTFRVLYAAEMRLAAFIETLQKWRPSLSALAALKLVEPSGEGASAVNSEMGFIPDDWHQKRGIGTLRLSPGQRWLDLRPHETREALRMELALALGALGLDDLDLSDVIGRNRRLTQAIARYAYEAGLQGIAYSSRFDSNLSCWAIFEGARFEQISQTMIARDDPDLLEAARRFGLKRA